MGHFRLWMWACLSVAVLTALAVGWARYQWEQYYRHVELAVNAGDLYALVQRGEIPSVTTAQEALSALGVRAWIVSPQDVRELRETFFPLRPGTAWTSLEELARWQKQGLALYWRLDVWTSPPKLPRLMDVLLAAHPRGLIVATPFPPWASVFSLKQLQAQDVRLSWDERAEDLPRLLALAELLQQGFRGLVRAHTVKLEERAALSDRAFVARYRRAALERNVRLLELRALSWEQLQSDVQLLTNALQRAGFALGSPSKISPFRLSLWTWSLLWLGVVSALVLTFAHIFRPSQRWLVGLWTLGALSGVISLGLAPELTRQAAAWLTVVFTPVLAFSLVQRTPPRTLADAFKAWLMFSAVAVLGGLVAAGFLSDEAYFLKLKAFRGVKAALLLPIAAVTVLALKDPHTRAALLARRKALALVGAAVASVFVVILVRSGNVESWPGLALERQVRDWLDAYLFVRPRFKEFLIGQPALWLWVGLLAQRSRPAHTPWAFGLLLLGLLAPISIVNSFAHLHTPLAVTLVRTFHGLWLGALLGGLLHRVPRLFRARSVD